MLERPGSTIAIWLAAAALAVFAGIRLLGGGQDSPPPVAIDAATAGKPAHASAAGLYVHVAGAVRRPGLIRVRQGTRVATALKRAGGPTGRADLTLVNLAARVQDGQQIVVPVAGGAAAGGPAAAIPPSLATATVDDLDEIDGIGPTLARRIVQQRTKKGGFRSVDELRDVDGIGEKRLAALRAALQP
jgi:competence protein ComEA